MKCLVTRLDVVINNDNLDKLGVGKVYINNNNVFSITSLKPFTASIVEGDGTFNDGSKSAVSFHNSEGKEQIYDTMKGVSTVEFTNLYDTTSIFCSGRIPARFWDKLNSACISINCNVYEQNVDVTDKFSRYLNLTNLSLGNGAIIQLETLIPIWYKKRVSGSMTFNAKTEINSVWIAAETRLTINFGSDSIVVMQEDTVKATYDGSWHY